MNPAFIYRVCHLVIVKKTGSGKTFTITGGAERYVDRGLIPRTLQFIFKETQKVSKADAFPFTRDISDVALTLHNTVAAWIPLRDFGLLLRDLQ